MKDKQYSIKLKMQNEKLKYIFRRITAMRSQKLEVIIKSKGKSIYSLCSVFCLLCSVLCLFACSCQSNTPNPENNKTKHIPSDFNAPPLILSILPVESAGAMYERFVPLKYYLENVLKRPVIIKVARDYETAIHEIGSGQVHIAYLDPSAYCEARYKYKVVPLAKAVMNNVSTYRGVIITRTNSGINRIIDSMGKRLALGNLRSSSSYLIPVVTFKEVGINLKDFSAVDYLQQEDRVALSVLIGSHDLGGISESVAERYIADGLKIIKTSEAIPQFSFCASDSLPSGLREQITRSLLSLSAKQHGKILSSIYRDLTGFVKAEDRDFDVVRNMIKNLKGDDYLEYGKKTVKVAILPRYSAITLFDRFDPLMRYLSKKTGYEFKLVIPKDFEDFVRVVRNAEVDFSYQNPYVYIQLAEEGSIKDILAMTIQSPTGDKFRGVIITRADGLIKGINDLKQKKAMIVSYRSAGGYLAQKLFLSKHGINADKDMKLIEGNRHETVILNVYLGKVDAGFVREPSLSELKEEINMEKISILVRTPYLPNWPFTATKRTNPRLSEQVKKALLELNDQKVLDAAEIERFRDSTDKDFEQFRESIESDVFKKN